jgi:xylose isomerase
MRAATNHLKRTRPMNRSVFVAGKPFFEGIDRIGYEGPASDNPLAFKAYDAGRIVAGKTMEEHLRFSVCYWHTFCATGQDPFGPGTRHLPWDDRADPMDRARDRLDAAFEFFTKLGAPYYCFHDRDLAPEGDNVVESERRLSQLVELARERQRATGVKLLWGTANLFSHPRYMNGAATNPDFAVVAHAAAQVKAALDATVALGGENYVFWGGREGYACLHNTDMRRELEHFARFLEAARDYGRSIGFRGTFLIEPKPMEPMKHQYDFDAQTTIGFLRHHGLAGDFKLNVEANHATLAGHSFAHELQACADAGLLGSIDANRGDPQNGWDTDQFPLDLYDCVQAMLVVLDRGGLAGGLNFDAKVRRESTDLEDLFIAHIGGMDAFARGLVVADRILSDPRYAALRRERYRSFDGGDGQRFERGEVGLAALREIAARDGEPPQRSGRQEAIENLINDHLCRGVN